MNTKILLAALSQDLYRVAMGLQTGSDKMAEKFTVVALETAKTIDTRDLKPHIKKILINLPKFLSEENINLKKEDALTYSIIIQNAALRMW